MENYVFEYWTKNCFNVGSTATRHINFEGGTRRQGLCWKGKGNKKSKKKRRTGGHDEEDGELEPIEEVYIRIDGNISHIYSIIYFYVTN